MGCELTAVFRNKKQRDEVHAFLKKNFRTFNEINPPIPLDMEGFQMYFNVTDFSAPKTTGITFGMSAWTDGMEREYALSVLSWLALKSENLREVNRFKGGECSYDRYLELPNPPQKQINFFLYDGEPWPVLADKTWGKFMSKNAPKEKTVDEMGIRVNRETVSRWFFFLKKKQIPVFYKSIEAEIKRLDKLFNEEFSK